MRISRKNVKIFTALCLISSTFLVLQFQSATKYFERHVPNLTVDSSSTSSFFQPTSLNKTSVSLKPLELRLERSRRQVESIGDSMYFVAYQRLLATYESRNNSAYNANVLRQRDLLDDLRDRATTLDDIVRQAGDAVAQLGSNELLPLKFVFFKIRQWTSNYLQNLSLQSGLAFNGSFTNCSLRFVLSSRQQLTELLNAWRLYTDASLNRPARIEALKDKLIQRWTRQQFPRNCATAKKLHCSKSNIGGFAVNVRWVVYCFWLAYVSGRVLQYNPIDWYYKAEPWSSVFLPITNCSDVKDHAPYFSNNTEKDLAVKLDFDVLQTWYYPENRLRSVPLDIADDLQLVDLDPFEFIGGLIARFAFKLQPDVQTRIDNEVKLMKLQHPIVGFHVRRTDKITEVPYQPLDAYFNAAEVYFSQLNKTESNTMVHSIRRRVLIATDEPSVISEARNTFPQYEIFASDFRASSAGMSSRKSNESLFNLLVDLYSLLETDYVVCTMSSNVCKVLHQLRQTDSAKAHNTYFVDLIFPEEFFGQRPRQFRVMYAQTDDSVHLPQTTQPNQNTTTSKPATGYLVTEVGDVIEFLQYEPYGLAVGVNNRTKQKGLFYLFKTEEVFNFFIDTLHSDKH